MCYIDRDLILCGLEQASSKAERVVASVTRVSSNILEGRKMRRLKSIPAVLAITVSAVITLAARQQATKTRD